jgi:hypothetical protein
VEKNGEPAIDNSHYRLILKLGKEMQINHHQGRQNDVKARGADFRERALLN